MRFDVNLIAIGGIFLFSCILFIALGLVLITSYVRAAARAKKRMARVVAQQANVGELDMLEDRLSLARLSQEAGLAERLLGLVARVIPIFDVTRLKQRITRAGMQMTIKQFVAVSLGLAAFLFAIAVLLTPYSPFLIFPPSLFLGMFLCNLYVGWRGERMARKFMDELPEALDMIIRGIRSGLPVIECIGMVGRELPDPIGHHFRVISERVKLGETIDTSLWAVARLIDRPEMNFFAVSTSIQLETGGSLAEALGNLAHLLRERKRMKKKVAAISSEAKASAMIIGSLPFVMLMLLAVISPDYISPLFNDPRGQMMLGAAGLSITGGLFIMWRMTQFEI